MHIREIHIQNVKRLRDLTISFLRGDAPRPWTVIVGENGLCKSTLLQAIALAASGPIRANQLADVPSLPDQRLEDARAEIHAEFGFSDRFHAVREYPGLPKAYAGPVEIGSVLRIESGWSVFQGESQYLTEQMNEQEPDPIDQVRARNLRHWFVAGYGVSRVLPRPMEASRPGDPAVGRLDPLFDRGRLVGTGFADLLPQPQKFGFELRRALVESGLLPRVSNLELRGRGGVGSAESLVQSHRFEMQAGPDTFKVPATWLSHGYQSTIAWVADLIGQVFWEAGEPVELEDMEGLVLIDEIDLHLHPKWQVSLVPTLKKVFPRMQFVVTTHSPMVLPGLEADEILLLSEDSDGNVVASNLDQAPALMTGSEIYDTFFGIDRLYPVDLGEELRRYGYLAGSPVRSDEEEAEMHRLRKKLQDAGVDPGWEPVPREPDSAGS